VADWNNNRVQIFAPNSVNGTTMTGLTGVPQGLFMDRLSNIYVALGSGGNRVRIQPNGFTIPISPQSNCNWRNSLLDAYGIAVDHAGNIYVSSATCHYVTQWQINGSNATRLIAQSPQLNGPRHMFFHERTSSLYVANTQLHVITKFQMRINITSQVVAGIQGLSGTASNQLNRPAGVYVSRIDGTIYVADMGNNRIQKFTVGASIGVTIAGNSDGLPGSSLSALNGPYGIGFDPNETFFYVAEYNNNRVQRFALP
jgi:DNA-binding beta-propeller fold protein YncE